jgi:hypothetical protein
VYVLPPRTTSIFTANGSTHFFCIRAVLVGRPPFETETQQATVHLIKNVTIQYPTDLISPGMLHHTMSSRRDRLVALANCMAAVD